MSLCKRPLAHHIITFLSPEIAPFAILPRLSLQAPPAKFYTRTLARILRMNERKIPRKKNNMNDIFFMVFFSFLLKFETLERFRRDKR
jgi:hypothetical protein